MVPKAEATTARCLVHRGPAKSWSSRQGVRRHDKRGRRMNYDILRSTSNTNCAFSTGPFRSRTRMDIGRLVPLRPRVNAASRAMSASESAASSKVLGAVLFLASRPAELLPHFNCVVADGLHDLLQLGGRNIQSSGPGPNLPAVAHIDFRPIRLDRLCKRGHRCALTKIAMENNETARPRDRSRASRSSFFFRWGSAIGR